MSVALATSLIESGGFLTEKVSAAYLDWYQHKPTGIGGTVKKAMKILEAYMPGSWSQLVSGQTSKDPESVGAGTVMRAAPLGVFYSQKPEGLRWACRQDAYITHANQEAYAASLAVASLIAGIIRHSDKDIEEQMNHAVGFMVAQLQPVVDDSVTYRALKYYMEVRGHENSPKEIADSLAGRCGSAWQITVTAIHCALCNLESFEAGLIDAVSLGGDTDTRGAVTGAILGALHGPKKIPLAWVEPLVNVNKGDDWAIPGKCASKLYQLDIELWQAANK
jgi:ADP-ribosylglycohydrolase